MSLYKPSDVPAHIRARTSRTIRLCPNVETNPKISLCSTRSRDLKPYRLSQRHPGFKYHSGSVTQVLLLSEIPTGPAPFRESCPPWSIESNPGTFPLWILVPVAFLVGDQSWNRCTQECPIPSR
jgi:hypothetical protein